MLARTSPAPSSGQLPIWVAGPLQADIATAGFTLLEMLVVITIMALLIVAMPQVSGPRPALRVREVSVMLAADLRDLRHAAMARRSVAALTLSPHGYTVQPGRGMRTIPSAVSITVRDDTPDLLGRQHKAAQCFPDGSCTASTFTVRCGAAAMFVELNWLDGSVSVHAG
jgi:general secretion pathway protein H